MRLQDRFRGRSGVRVLLSAVLTLASALASADLYMYKDPDGGILITDRTQQGKGYKLLKTVRSSVPPVTASSIPWSGGGLKDSKTIRANRARYEPLIAKVASHEKLDSRLLHAVIRVESAYNPGALSPAGAQGLMQLMPGTAERYGVIDVWDPEANLKGGARYLKDLLTLFDNDLELALAAYNAGEERVKQYGYQIPPYPETQQYVRKVMNHYRQGIFGGS